MTQRVFILGGAAFLPNTSTKIQVIDLDVLEIEDRCPLCQEGYEYTIEDEVCSNCGIDWSMTFNELDRAIEDHKERESS